MTEDMSVRRFFPIDIEDELRSSFLEYSMSVIVARALPGCARWAEAGSPPDPLRDERVRADARTAPYKKSAWTVGEVIGKYHPHGDSGRLRHDGPHGAGLLDARAARSTGTATSARSTATLPRRCATPRRGCSGSPWSCCRDLDKETVDFGPNYDESLEEPLVLPARFPNLLVNGSSGIAVGMATNIPPHNLGETIDAVDACHRQPRGDRRRPDEGHARALTSPPAA